MDLELAGKVAIVTGGASGGLGENMAARLLEEGCRVMVADRNAERNAELVARLAPLGEVAGHVSDVSTEDFAEPLAAATVEAFGGIDVVVNNAATYPSHPWNEYTLEEWDRTINTNLRSLFLMSKATVPHIAARGGGSIVNIGSITFAIGMANILPYVTSKGGLVGFTRALAREVGAQNIRVNNVSPGAFPTGGETIHPDPEGYSRFVIEQQSLKRRGTRRRSRRHGRVPRLRARLLHHRADDPGRAAAGRSIELALRCPARRARSCAGARAASSSCSAPSSSSAPTAASAACAASACARARSSSRSSSTARSISRRRPSAACRSRGSRPTGLTAPGLAVPAGWEPFRTFFGGLLTTCGLEHTLGPADRRRDAISAIPGRPTHDFPLHGRLSATPGRLLGYGVDWERECVFCRGDVRQAHVFGESLTLEREIRIGLGGTTIELDDVVRNDGFAPTPHMILYHVNVGWPLLGERAEVVAGVGEPRVATPAAEGADWRAVDAAAASRSRSRSGSTRRGRMPAASAARPCSTATSATAARSASSWRGVTRRCRASSSGAS